MAAVSGGGGGEGRSLDTAIDGSPEAIRRVAHWLRDDFGSHASELAESVFRQRSRAASDWQGEAGTAFQRRSRVLADAADSARDSALIASHEVDALAGALDTALSGMDGVRRDARAGGLLVSGTLVFGPGPAPPQAGPSPTAGAPRSERDAWDDANQAVLDHNAKVEVWNRAVADHARIMKAWVDALGDAAAAWVKWDKELSGLSADFLTAAAEIALIVRVAPVLAGQVDFLKTQAATARGHMAALQNADGRVHDRGLFFRHLDEALDLEQNRIPQATREATHIKVPRAVGHGLGIFGVAATGYAIHEDMEEGESATQATVSNVAGFGASIAAGAYIGGAVGTAIPVPVLGTVTGVVVGAAVGTVVGAFTSGAIDSLWESGADSLGDAGDAVMDGLEEVGNTASAIGDVAEDAWDAIF